jgi:hypothetical protein
MPEKRTKEQKAKDDTDALKHAPNLFSRMQKHAGIKAMDSEGDNKKAYAWKYLQIKAHISGSHQPPHKDSDPIYSR